MLISPDNKETAIIAARVEVIDEQGFQVQTVYSFDTITKTAEIFLLNEKGAVRVVDGKPVTVKEHKPGWKVFDKFTGKEVM